MRRRLGWLVGGSSAGCGCLVAVGGVGALVLVSGGVALYVASSYWENALRGALAQATGGEVDFDGLRLSWSGLVVSGVVVTASDGQPCVTVDRLKVGARDLSLFEGDDWHLTSLELSGVVADLHRTNGGWALPTQTLAWLHLTGDDALPSIHVPTVTVRDARLDATTPAGTVVRAHLDEAQLTRVEVVVGDAGATLSFGAGSGEGLQFSLGNAVTGTAKGFETAGSAGVWSFTTQPAVGDLVVRAVDVALPGGRLTAGTTHLSGARWDQGVSPKDADASDLSFAVGGERLTVDRVRASGFSRVAFGAPFTVDTVAAGAVTTGLRDVSALAGVVRGLLAIPDLRQLPVTIRSTTADTVAWTGAPVRATGASVRGARWSGSVFTAEHLGAQTLTAGPVVVRDVAAPQPSWDPARPLRLGTVTAQGLVASLDPYAPYLGLPEAVFGAAPVGLGVVALVFPGAQLTVAASGRTATGTFGALRFDDLVVDEAAVRARAVTATAGDGTVTSPSGTLGWLVARASADDVVLGAQTTVQGGVLEGLALGGKGSRVASVDRVQLGADGVARVSGASAWTSLVKPHALDVPPLAADHVPRGLGGQASGNPAWWGLDVQGLPWTLQRVEGSGGLTVRDRVVGDHAFQFQLSSFAVGPRGGEVLLEAHGEVAGGKFDVVGRATGDGRVVAKVDAKSIDAREFESYGTRLMQVSGLGIGPGRIAVELDVTLTPTTLSLSGDLRFRNLTLVVRDKKKLGAALLAVTRGGRFEIPEQYVPIEVSCPLSEVDCSPLDQVAKIVTDTLLASVSGGVTGGTGSGVGGDVKDAVNDVLKGIPGAGKRGKGR